MTNCKSISANKKKKIDNFAFFIHMFSFLVLLKDLNSACDRGEKDKSDMYGVQGTERTWCEMGEG